MNPRRLRSGRRPPLASRLLFAAVIASAAQLAPLVWRAEGHRGGYFANEDERFYYAAFAAAAREPLRATNPFDREWFDAAPAGVRLLALTASLPVRLGVDPGVAWDAARWLGSFTSAALLVAIGTAVATPGVGAAAAVLVLLDPGAFYGKPLLSLVGIGVHAADDPHQLVTSRAMVSSMTLPLFLLCVLATVRLARSPRTAHRAPWRPVLAIASVAISSHLFTWSGALAGAAGAAVLHPRRRRLLVPVAAACVLAMVLVLIGGLGRHGAPLTDVIMRLGAIRTHRPLFLTHVGFWAAALAGAVLVFAPGRFSTGARAIGGMMLGAWALAMLHTPIFGWDVESYHFAHAMGPLSMLAWCALVWHLWRRRKRRQPLVLVLLWPVALALSAVAFRGPILAVRGLEASIAEGGQRRDEVAAWLERGAIPARASVVMPRDLQNTLSATHTGITFAAPYQMQWSVPDTTLFHRAVCAAALTGIDSAEARRHALKPRPGSIAVWHDGRPADVSLSGVRVYFDIFDTLGSRLGGAIAESNRVAATLARYCYERPDYALAVGGPHVMRAEMAAAVLGGRVHWRAPDGRAVWMRLR